MADCGLSRMTPSIRPSVRKPQKTWLRDEVARVLANIRCVLAHSFSGKLQSVSYSGLTSLTRSFTKSFIFIAKEGEFVDERSNEFWDKFCKLKEQKDHEHRTTGASIPTDHKLTLELNKGLAYGFCAEESSRLRTQSQHTTLEDAHCLVVMRSMWPALVVSIRLDPSQMPPLELLSEWQMPNRETTQPDEIGSSQYSYDDTCDVIV
ncbi:hypothetical protein M9H77_22668 [Catharanthus roseus]|uniref:Uncharacterized protein n=1 Tax=Catharanthus roseus TaxID=4058 RepID=A0ACC0ASL7_CATRO|nr:hypothetical protein M9H77_22668 [Catharanthus roseus]